MRSINLLFLTRQNFLRNTQSGGYQLTKNLFLCYEKNTDINVSLCIIDIDYDGREYENEYQLHDISVIPISKGAVKRNISYLFLRSGHGVKESRAIRNIIKKSNADIVFFDGTWFGSNIRYVREGVKKIVFCHNIEKEFALDRIRTTRRLTAVPRFFSDWYNESCAIWAADKIICLNERDNALLFKNYKRYADMLLSIMLEDQFDINAITQTKTQKKIILFVGSLFYANVDGIRWFCKNVMPFVECELYIIGKGMEGLREELAGERIRVFGTVDSVSGYYNKADLVVIPIFSGGGMKVKTAEAMMYGKRILATDEALEGYRVEETEDIIRCNTAKEFIEAINNNGDNEEAGRFSEKNRSLFLRYYNADSAFQRMKELLGDIMDEKN